ncbi:MAG TPA: hypothetical protein VHG72_22805 [Polyangia bacterium]|nr:hypothetical protein [Polyangia bacterium]
MQTTERNGAVGGEAAARIDSQVEQAKRQLSSWNEALTDYIKENPVRCLLGALAVGYVIGKIARRL